MRPDPLTENSPFSAFSSFALIEPEPDRFASSLALLPFNWFNFNEEHFCIQDGFFCKCYTFVRILFFK